jgi:hypothetical protein
MTAFRHKRHWWNHDIETPIAAVPLCCLAMCIVLAFFCYVAGGLRLAIIFLPVGFFAGGHLALSLSNYPTMRVYRRIRDVTIGRIAKIVFFYGLPLWAYMAFKYGIGLILSILGAISAAVMFGIGGTLSLAAVCHLWVTIGARRTRRKNELRIRIPVA